VFPFSVQNAFTGVLDAKRNVELGVEDYVRELGASFVVLRIGKLSEDKVQANPAQPLLILCIIFHQPPPCPLRTRGCDGCRVPLPLGRVRRSPRDTRELGVCAPTDTWP